LSLKATYTPTFHDNHSTSPGAVYQKILEHGTGDSFYIRTHFKYEKSGGHEMSFKQGSTFRISDTLYQGMVGYWLAVRIGRNNMEIERGVIPNSSRWAYCLAALFETLLWRRLGIIVTSSHLVFLSVVMMSYLRLLGSGCRSLFLVLIFDCFVTIRAEQLKMVQDKKKLQMKERTKGGIGRRLAKSQKSDTPLSSSSSSMFPAYERVVLREGVEFVWCAKKHLKHCVQVVVKAFVFGRWRKLTELNFVCVNIFIFWFSINASNVNALARSCIFSDVFVYTHIEWNMLGILRCLASLCEYLMATINAQLFPRSP